MGFLGNVWDVWGFGKLLLYENRHNELVDDEAHYTKFLQPHTSHTFYLNPIHPIHLSIAERLLNLRININGFINRVSHLVRQFLHRI